MEEYYYYGGGHVPAFGSWDWNNDLPFTQCFESARQAGFLRYSYSGDPDLYLPGDLYHNDVVVSTPAVIAVPRRPRQQQQGKVRQSRTKQGKTMKKQQQHEQEEEQEMGYHFKEYQEVVVKEPPSPPPDSSATSLPRPNPKPVDEDLYKISPDLLYASSKPKKKKRAFGIFSSCLLPTCVV